MTPAELDGIDAKTTPQEVCSVCGEENPLGDVEYGVRFHAGCPKETNGRGVLWRSAIVGSLGFPTHAEVRRLIAALREAWEENARLAQEIGAADVR